MSSRNIMFEVFGLRGLILAAAILLITPAVLAQPPEARDYEVKAGFLVKFSQYTTWPSDTFTFSNAPVVIGVLGRESVFKQLEQEGRGVASSRPVEVRRVSTVEEAARCQVVFICAAGSVLPGQW